VMFKLNSRVMLAGAAMCALAVSGCGDVARSGRAPAQVVIEALTAASGAEPQEFFGNLSSDVITNRTQPAPCSPTSPCPTVFNDLGQVQMSLVLRNPGQPGLPSAATPLNAVTMNRYRVEYRRTDGRNVPGVDVPYAFDSAATFTVPATGSVTGVFELVRNTAKMEAPLRELTVQPHVLSTIATVTFYGRDQAGNEVSATGQIGVSFGNFGDPQ
jgi:hypothetical protein